MNLKTATRLARKLLKQHSVDEQYVLPTVVRIFIDGVTQSQSHEITEQPVNYINIYVKPSRFPDKITFGTGSRYNELKRGITEWKN